MLTGTTSRVAPWLCAALLAGPAWADATAQLRLEDFGWTLVDLRPGDGIAPGVSFDGSRIGSRMLARVHETYAGADGSPQSYPSDITDRFVGMNPFPRDGQLALLNTSGINTSQGGFAAHRSFGVSLWGQARSSAEDSIYLNLFQARTVPAASSFVGAVVLAPYTRLV
jgi:hypothetical protein